MAKKNLPSRKRTGKHTLPKAAEKYKFKKGQSGNPEGARAHNPAVKALKKLTIETYREIIELVMTGNLASLKAVAKDPKTSAVQVGIANAFLKAIEHGDYTVIERIAERIVGKIPDTLNVNSNEKFDPAMLKAAILEIKSSL